MSLSARNTGINGGTKLFHQSKYSKEQLGKQSTTILAPETPDIFEKEKFNEGSIKVPDTQTQRPPQEQLHKTFLTERMSNADSPSILSFKNKPQTLEISTEDNHSTKLPTLRVKAEVYDCTKNLDSESPSILSGNKSITSNCDRQLEIDDKQLHSICKSEDETYIDSENWGKNSKPRLVPDDSDTLSIFKLKRFSEKEQIKKVHSFKEINMLPETNIPEIKNAENDEQSEIEADFIQQGMFSRPIRKRSSRGRHEGSRMLKHIKATNKW